MCMHISALRHWAWWMYGPQMHFLCTGTSMYPKMCPGCVVEEPWSPYSHNQHPCYIMMHVLCTSNFLVVGLVGSYQLNFSTTNDDYSHHWNSAAGYQLAQSVVKIGCVLAERLGQREVGRCTTLGDSAWLLWQLAVEKPWSALGGPFFRLLAQTGVENDQFT